MIKTIKDKHLSLSPIISKSIQIIANDIGKVRFKVVKFNSYLTTTKYKEIESRLTYLLNENPNPQMTGFEFKKIIVWNLFIYGKAYIRKIVDDKTKLLTQLVPLDPELVKTDDTRSKYSVSSNFDNEVVDYKASEIIEINYETIQNILDPSFNGLFGSYLKNLKEKEFLSKDDEGLKMIAFEISIIFGIPAQKLGVYINTNNYVSSSEATKIYINNTLTPLLLTITQKLSKELINAKTYKIIHSSLDFLRLYDPENFVNISNSIHDDDTINPDDVKYILGLEE